MSGKETDDLMDARSNRAVGPILETWMNAVAPPRAPERLLEESFARTMVARQVRVLPWDALRLGRRGSAAGNRIGRMALAGIALALTIVVVGGLLLRPSQEGIGGPSPSVPAPSPSASPLASGRPSPSPSVTPFPSPVVVAPTAAIPVTGGLSLATDGTSIWLLAPGGKLMRIDPATNTVTASVTLTPGGNAYQSLDGDRVGLWVTDWDGTRVLRFDPVTLRATASIEISSKPKGVLVTSGAVWVANTRGGSVERIDPTTNKVVATIAVGPTGPSGPNWLARGLGSIWTGVPNTGSVVRINEATNTIEATIQIPGPASPCGGLAAGTTAIWITSCDGGNLVTQIDPATNTVVGTIDLRGRSYTIALIADRPWISPTDGQIVRIDPMIHAVDRVVSPGPGFASGGGDVVVAAGSLWINDWAANQVLRLPIAAFGG